jgi:hypothetical protein
VWIKEKDNTEADVLSRIPYYRAGKEDIVKNGLQSFRPADAWLTAAADKFEEVQLVQANNRF